MKKVAQMPSEVNERQNLPPPADMWMLKQLKSSLSAYTLLEGIPGGHFIIACIVSPFEARGLSLRPTSEQA